MVPTDIKFHATIPILSITKWSWRPYTEWYFLAGPSLGHWYPEQEHLMVSKYASPFPLSMQAGDPVLSTQSSFNMDEFFKDLQHDKPQFCAPNVSMLPTDIGSSMTKLPSCRRWVKLSALVKWKAIMRASKRARLMFEQESWSPWAVYTNETAVVVLFLQ